MMEKISQKDWVSDYLVCHKKDFFPAKRSHLHYLLLHTSSKQKIKFMREPDDTLIYLYFKSIDKRKFDNVVLSLRKTDNCDLTMIRSTPAVLRHYTTRFKHM